MLVESGECNLVYGSDGRASERCASGGGAPGIFLSLQ